jgi:uncharacterized membrane protein
MNFLIAYIASVIVFLALDALWLGVIMKDTYMNGLSHLMAQNANFFVAAAFYVFYVIGLTFFATMPGVSQGSWMIALGYGAFFGLCAYATYEMTNLSTLRDWPVNVAVIDMACGAVLSGVSATAGYFALNLLGRI